MQQALAVKDTAALAIERIMSIANDGLLQDSLPPVSIDGLSEKRGLQILKFLKKKGCYEVFENSQLKDLPPGIRVRAPLEFFERFKYNPREFFDPETINELGESIKMKGDVEKPVHVTMRYSEEQGFYLLIIDGESRHRAATNVDLSRLSAFLHPPMTDAEVYLMSAKANAGRSQLSPIEEAKIIVNLEIKYGMTNKQIADTLSKSVATVTNTRKYLALRKSLQKALLKKEITKGEALAIATVVKDKQGMALNAVRKKKREKGKALTQNELAIVIRVFKEAAGANVSQPKTKRSRPESSAADLILNRIFRASEKFVDELESLRTLKKADVVGSGTVNIVDLTISLEQVKKGIERQLGRLHKWE